jgi:hypothetical protein
MRKISISQLIIHHGLLLKISAAFNAEGLKVEDLFLGT